MTYRKVIELFLVNGIEENLVMVNVFNWNGKVIKILRKKVKQYSCYDIRNAGVYFFSYKEAFIYIKEVGNVLDRLNQHLRDYNVNKKNIIVIRLLFYKQIFK